MNARSASTGAEPVEDRYREWDGAYVLGALPAHERLEYERHLATCDVCAARVAELAGMPGILGVVPDERGLELVSAGMSAELPAGLVLSTLAAARRSRRRTTTWRAVAVGGMAAAAAAVTVAVLVTQPGEDAVAMTQVVPSPITADVTLRPDVGGTRIEITCRYADTGSTPEPGAPVPPFEYVLVVTDDEGNQTEPASWMASPGSVIHPAAMTSLDPDEIQRLEIRVTDFDAVILELEPGENASG